MRNELTNGAKPPEDNYVEDARGDKIVQKRLTGA